MTLPEFKAWFEGFTEDMDGAPSKKQWERIKARVGEITGTPLTYPVYVDRYVRPYYHSFPGAVYSNLCSQGIGVNSVATAQSMPASSHVDVLAAAMNIGCSAAEAKADEQRRTANNQTVVWNAQEAMNALGRADAAELAAA